MKEVSEYPHNIPDDVEYFENDSDLEALLNKISPYIGWIIIELNSLEGMMEYIIKEIVSTSEARDNFIYIFLSKMDFSSKMHSLTSMYGYIIESCNLADLREELKFLKTKLFDACERRNTYAHADWSGISTKNLVATKYSANRRGVKILYKTFEIKDMEADIEFIREVKNELDLFDEKINDAIF